VLFFGRSGMTDHAQIARGIALIQESFAGTEILNRRDFRL
jgi:hypothetical protein